MSGKGTLQVCKNLTKLIELKSNEVKYNWSGSFIIMVPCSK
jgi:hypothetical protein